jgi:GGDEF domain-containing protein
MSVGTPPEHTNVDPGAIKEHYLRTLKLSYLTRFGFFVVAGLFLAFALPFMPFGLDATDYTSTTMLAFGLALLAINLALLSMFFFVRAAQRREVMLAWSAVFDESTGLHNRTYFLERLDMEIERVRGTSRTFRVFLLQARHQDSSGRYVRMTRSEMADFAAILHDGLGDNDTLASLRPDELAVLAPGAHHHLVAPTEHKLNEAVMEFLRRSKNGRPWKIRMGTVAFDGNTEDPTGVLEDARRTLLASPAVMLTDLDVA